MAIATLARIYNNYDVFKKEVKIRKGEAVQIMMYGSDYENLIAFFGHYIKEVRLSRPLFFCPHTIEPTLVCPNKYSWKAKSLPTTLMPGR